MKLKWKIAWVVGEDMKCRVEARDPAYGRARWGAMQGYYKQ